MTVILKKSTFTLCLLLAVTTNCKADEWSQTTFINWIQVNDNENVLRLHVNGDMPNPAICAGSSSILDIPLYSTKAQLDNRLIKTIYIALLNHHHVEMLIDSETCSESKHAVLSGIKISRSRHHNPHWPLGDRN